MQLPAEVQAAIVKYVRECLDAEGHPERAIADIEVRVVWAPVPDKECMN